MQFIKGKHDGLLHITEDTEITGMVTGKVTVAEGANLLLRGNLTADLEVFGSAEIVGTVVGTVFNSGKLVVSGTVGSVVDSHTGVTKILSSGVVRDS